MFSYLNLLKFKLDNWVVDVFTDHFRLLLRSRAFSEFLCALGQKTCLDLKRNMSESFNCIL